MANTTLLGLRPMLEQDLAWGPDVKIPADHHIMQSYGQIHGIVNKMAATLGIGFNKPIEIPVRDKNGRKVTKAVNGQVATLMKQVEQPLKLRLSKLLRAMEVLHAASVEEDADKATAMATNGTTESYGIQFHDGQYLLNPAVQNRISTLTEDDLNDLLAGIEDAINAYVATSKAAFAYRTAEAAKSPEQRAQESAELAETKARQAALTAASSMQTVIAPVSGAVIGFAKGLYKGFVPAGAQEKLAKLADDAKSQGVNEGKSITIGNTRFVIQKDTQSAQDSVDA